MSPDVKCPHRTTSSFILLLTKINERTDCGRESGHCAVHWHAHQPPFTTSWGQNSHPSSTPILLSLNHSTPPLLATIKSNRVHGKNLYILIHVEHINVLPVWSAGHLGPRSSSTIVKCRLQIVDFRDCGHFRMDEWVGGWVGGWLVDRVYRILASGLPITYYVLRITYYGLRITDNGLRFTVCGLRWATT